MFVFLYGSNQSLIHRLQLVQNSSARVIAGILNTQPHHPGAKAKDLHWFPVKARIKFKILLMVFQCVYGHGPRYLEDLFDRRGPLHYALDSDLNKGYIAGGTTHGLPFREKHGGSCFLQF